MHKLVDELQIHIEIPILNIIDAAADQIKEKELHTIGLLGTRFTMEENFYKDRLKENHDLEVLIPSREERETIHRIITNELSIGKIREPSKKIYWDIINRLADQGAQGIILGCTEIPLLVHEEEGNIPLFDTTLIHATAAVEYALLWR
jgi:aspartate racemase